MSAMCMIAGDTSEMKVLQQPKVAMHLYVTALVLVFGVSSKNCWVAAPEHLLYSIHSVQWLHWRLNVDCKHTCKLFCCISTSATS